MDLKLLNILCCPSCKKSLTCTAEEVNSKGRIMKGQLNCSGCPKSYPIIRAIPRFVEMQNYAESFGFQWNLYKHTQVDIFSTTTQSENRFFSETGWTKESMRDNWVLEGGCGNGRFIDVCSRTDCQIVGVDLSSAVDAAKELFAERDNVHLVQASLYELPFADETFDKCYSIGVIQHTPSPKRSIQALAKLVKSKGSIALTIYEKKPWTLLYAKYWLRPFTKRLNKKLLLNSIKIISPILFPITEILFRIPLLGRIFKFIIPYANYVRKQDLSLKQRYEWAILDTFDMLSPTFDKPMTHRAVYSSLEEMGLKNITRLLNPGVNMVAIK
jgi:SAM-dependent methyltransferase